MGCRCGIFVPWFGRWGWEWRGDGCGGGGGLEGGGVGGEGGIGLFERAFEVGLFLSFLGRG